MERKLPKIHTHNTNLNFNLTINIMLNDKTLEIIYPLN